MKKLLLFVFACTLLGFVGCTPKTNPGDGQIYSVVFDAGGDSPTPAVQGVRHGEVAKKPTSDPTRAGFTFMFWHLKGVSTEYDFSTPVTRSIILVAAWQANDPAVEYWQVTWELNGGNWPENPNHLARIEKGETLAEPRAPLKDDNTFVGWYLDQALTRPAAFPLAVSGNVTLWSKWTVDEPDPIDDARLVGKWEAKDNSLGIEAVEFSTDGYYIVTASRDITTRADDEPKLYFGTFTVEDDGQVVLTDLGRMMVKTLGEESIAFVFEMSGSSVEIEATKAEEMPSSEKNDLLCRTWICTRSEVGDPDWLPTEVGAYYYLSRAGTVLAWSDGYYVLGRWAWKPDTDNELLLWLWDDEEEAGDDQRTVLEKLTATELITLESDEWGWTRTWFRAAKQ